jgi:hypothetical protein
MADMIDYKTEERFTASVWVHDPERWRTSYED